MVSLHEQGVHLNAHNNLSSMPRAGKASFGELNESVNHVLKS